MLMTEEGKKSISKVKILKFPQYNKEHIRNKPKITLETLKKSQETISI